MLIICLADNSHEMSRLTFSEKKIQIVVYSSWLALSSFKGKGSRFNWKSEEFEWG